MKTLILNLDFTPLCIVSWQRGLTLSLKNKNLRVLEYYDKVVYSESDVFEIPSVILYHRYVTPPKAKNVSKSYVLARDGMVCQYCRTKLDSKTATVDHVIPLARFKSKKEANTWDNLVACCKSCNSKKGGRTPTEAGMELIKNPKRPTRFLYIDSGPETWRNYDRTIKNKELESSCASE